jgi:hypothetical protein
MLWCQVLMNYVPPVENVHADSIPPGFINFAWAALSIGLAGLLRGNLRAICDQLRTIGTSEVSVERAGP